MSKSFPFLPQFSQINPIAVGEALSQLLIHSREKVALLTTLEEPTFENLVVPLEEIDVQIDKLFSPISHLNSVKSTETLRKVYEEGLEKLSDYSTDLGQNQALYQAFKTLKSSKVYHSYTPEQKKIVENTLLDFKLSGVALEENEREQFKQLSKEISKLHFTFQNNVSDATDAFEYWVKDIQELNGLSSVSIELAKDKANRFAKEEGLTPEQLKKKGEYLLGIDYPTYAAVITYADNEKLRQTFYEAYVTKASDLGPHDKNFDNTKIMEEILQKSHQCAKLLGYKDYVEYSMAKKMANSGDEVTQFLLDLAQKAKPFAIKDLEELKKFAKETHLKPQLNAWDLAYYAEKLKEEKYSFSDEALRLYFPVSQVLTGLFGIVNKLYGITISQENGVDVWHDSVQFFSIRDKDNQLRGMFYLDLYARPLKRGGAWMDECLVRHKFNESVQLPVAYLVTNFRAPLSDQEATLTHDEVLTLFHEFGHGLHHMLTLVNYPSIAGINGVPWDAVELPSQFMENFCWEEEALALISRHVETKMPIDKHLYEKMLRAKNYQSGLRVLRQIEFALFDIKVHQALNHSKTLDVQNIIDLVRKEVSVNIPPHFNRFQHSFTHIFSGGYSAGYYSYLWADLLASDAYSRFEDEGIFNPMVGQAFMENILEKGGSDEPLKLFKAFRGREPSIEALLRHNGLVLESNSI